VYRVIKNDCRGFNNFLISNFRRVFDIVSSLLGVSPASDFCMPTFRNHLSVPSSKAGYEVWRQLEMGTGIYTGNEVYWPWWDQLVIHTTLEIAVYVFCYLVEQHSKFLLHTVQVLYMCTICDSTNIIKNDCPVFNNLSHTIHFR
jgi:hypothetical protein